jgi:LytS/YehU family sensor histidine kinase
MLLHGILFGYLVKSKHFNLMYSSLYNSIPFLFTITVSIVYRYLKDNLKENAILKEKQAENLKTELSFLRSQISPHFLFNVLNNIVALVRIKSDELEPSIMKLSSILQYMLYETDEENVSLSNEIEYLRSYIDLQKQRFGIKLSTQITFTIEENWHRIEPMLLIPFIENAFKHGFSNIQNPEINIELTVKNNVLEFSVKNKFNANSEEVKDKTSGIGLVNVKRRLELLYGEKQQLYISKQDDWFTILLRLNLQS